MATSNQASQQAPGTTWSEEENVQLCEAWKVVCHNPIAGDEQTQSGMWRKIHQLFSTGMGGTTRQQGAMPSHWKHLSKTLGLWKNALKHARDGAGSGYSVDDEINYAMRWYAINNKNVAFSHHLCWEVVKDCPRFRIQPQRDVFRESSSAENTPVQDSPGDTSVDMNLTDDDVPSPDPAPTPSPDPAPTPAPATNQPAATRPQGRKAAKASRRQGPSQAVGLLEQIARNSALRIEEQRRFEEARLAARQEDNERLRRLEEEKAERRREKEEFRIMSMDTSHMSPETKQYWQEERRGIIMRRRLFREAESSASDAYTPTPPAPADESHPSDTDWLG